MLRFFVTFSFNLVSFLCVPIQFETVLNRYFLSFLFLIDVTSVSIPFVSSYLHSCSRSSNFDSCVDSLGNPLFYLGSVMLVGALISGHQSKHAVITFLSWLLCGSAGILLFSGILYAITKSFFQIKLFLQVLVCIGFVVFCLYFITVLAFNVYYLVKWISKKV